MHILILPAWYPSASDPVRGSFFAEQAEALARRGHTVSVFSLRRSRESGVRVETVARGDLTEYAIHYGVIRFHLTYVRIVAAMARLLRRELAGRRPDIIHVHTYLPMKYARALKALFGIPYVVTEHVSWFQRDIVSRRDLRRAARGYRSAAAVLAVSSGLGEAIRPLCGGGEIRVIPNLVSPRFLEGGLHAPPGETFGFVTVGTLDRVKGHDVLLRAFARAVKEEPRLTLTVIGGGPEAEPLRALAEELGIEGKTVFTGPVAREEVGRRLRESQAFALASRTETFGVVFIEAMACGLPIVMTKTNAWEELAAPETGLAVAVEDEDALTAALLDVVRHYDRYDPEAIAERCRASYSEDAVCRRLEAVYEEVLQR